jgi:hypothetical protein
MRVAHYEKNEVTRPDEIAALPGGRQAIVISEADARDPTAPADHRNRRKTVSK